MRSAEIIAAPEKKPTEDDHTLERMLAKQDEERDNPHAELEDKVRSHSVSLGGFWCSGLIRPLRTPLPGP